jgi:chromate transporter
LSPPFPFSFDAFLADFDGRFEWFAALTGLAAFVALIKYKIGIIPLVLACGTAGLVYTLLI